MEKALLCWCAVLCVIGFFLMGWDKRQAKRELRRIPERRFFLIALAGGALGTILGMYAFHHKTRHWYFRWGLPAILLLHLALAWSSPPFSEFLPIPSVSQGQGLSVR